MRPHSQSHVADEANKVFKPPRKEATEYEKAEQSFRANRERLKAERLGREAEAQTQTSRLS